MVRLNSAEELYSAWRALTGTSTSEGWRTIPVGAGLPIEILAARHFPGDEEAVLVSFGNVVLPLVSALPQGRGFLVSKVEFSWLGRKKEWLVLTRKDGANLELFSIMALDVLNLLENTGSISRETLLQIFLGRIRAWQDFMERGSDPKLAPEAEVGLFGEIMIVQDLIEAGVPFPEVVEAWVGPLKGIQDFAIGLGAIEVKSTLSPAGFSARITSLDQLDDLLKNPLFLVFVRLAPDPDGKTLPEAIIEISQKIEKSPIALNLFLNRLICAGFLEGLADRYIRRFLRTETRIFPVSGTFPRLTHANVPQGIKSVQYELTLPPDIPQINFKQALQQLREK